MSRATYYRHKDEWTWEYLLDVLLPAHRPKSAARLEQLRRLDPAARDGFKDSEVARLAPLIASVAPKADEQDLLFALEGMLVEAEDSLAGTPPSNEWPGEDHWFLMTTTAKLLVERLGICRPAGSEEWRGASEVVARLYEFASIPEVRALGHRTPDLHGLDDAWVYCLVRSGASPRKAVRKVQEAWASAHPDYSPYDRALWVSAAHALLDRRGYEREMVTETPEESQQRDAEVMSNVLHCSREAAPSFANGTKTYPIGETGNLSGVLLAALGWHWARENAVLRSLASFIRGATRDGTDLRYGNSADESTAFAWATWTLADSSQSSENARRAAEVLLRFTLIKCQTVAREIGGTSLELRAVPPVAVHYLLAAGRTLSAHSEASDALADLVERIASARATSAWSRLPRPNQEAWSSFLDEAPATLRLHRVAPRIRLLRKILDSLESDFTAGARVEVEDVAALTDAAERIARLTAWATAGEWSAPWDAPEQADVGVPFNKPPAVAPEDAETLRRIIHLRVSESIAKNLSRSTMAVKWAPVASNA